MNIHCLLTGKPFVFLPTEADCELGISVMTPSITSLKIAAQTFLLFLSLVGFLLLLTPCEKMREAQPLLLLHGKVSFAIKFPAMHGKKLRLIIPYLSSL